MDVTQIDITKYTHIHFAFANITSSFAIDVSGAQNQFNSFKALTGVKKIITFGGWDFSTAPGTFNILREATKAANRAKFESNIVAFLQQHSLDGVDLDWEYPGTKDALSLITKAGVPSNKIVVGVSSYGRSFKMAQAGCTGPSCKFTGSPRVSNAAKGRCTGTSGYLSNAEIYDIITFGKVNKQWVDADSNILVYNDTEWVAYMNSSIKAEMASLYASYNFAGTSDWAVDLEEFVDGSGDDEGYDPNYVASIDLDYFMDCDAKYDTLDQLLERKSSIPSYCIDQYIVDVEIKIMSSALTKYDDLVNGGYDKKFKIYERYTIEQVPDQINAFMGNGHAGDYFKCQETLFRTCCSSCRYAACAEDCDKSADCKNGVGTQDVTCPTVYKDGPIGIDYFNTGVPNVTYTLQNSDRFYSAISKDYGIEKDWIVFGDIDVRKTNGCQYSGNDNYPTPASNIKVFNPKDIVGKSYDKFKDLLDRLQTLNAIGDLDLLLNMQDVADASSLPALTIASAIDSMDKVLEAVGEIEKIEREEFIVNFLGGILFFIPFVGEALEASLVAIRTALSIAEVAGEAGLLTYSIVEDPSNAFSAVFSTLAGAGLSRGSWGKAASERRGLSDSDSMKLGSIHVDLEKIDNLRAGKCTL
ncbi:hypothetical protein F4824DRAFT_489691 [Ustulina deusta]|nr:hypothetical protein F4824DRAFT_489691 [Ustulina deusta]